MTALDRFFEAFFRRRPVDATFIGLHDHDELLPDASEDGVEESLAEVRSLRKEIASQPPELDAELAAGALDVLAWEYESGYFLRNNPAWYTGEAIFGVFSLLLRDFAPLDERMRRASARLERIPAFLQQGGKNVASAPAAWIERAISECDGALAFLGEGLRHLPAMPETPVRDAAAAFDAFRARLSREVEPSDSYSCGGDALELLLRRGHVLDDSPAEILALAEDVRARSAAALAEGASHFGESDFRDVLARLEDRHPSRESYYDRYRELWEESRRLVETLDLVTWPDFPVDFRPRPRWSWSAAPHLYFLFYRSPPPLDALPRAEYHVSPVEPDMTEAEAERILRATNDRVIKVNHVVHHGGIGHHVQNAHAAAARSRIGRVAAVDGASRIALFCGGTMAEGWACYATDLMAEAGFFTELELYAEHHARLRMAARAMVDVKIHTGGSSFAEAEAFYREEAAMTAPAARAEVTKNTMFPGAALIYLVGSTRLHELRRERQRALAGRFTPRSFHDELLSYGSIPVSLVAREMRKSPS